MKRIRLIEIGCACHSVLQLLRTAQYCLLGIRPGIRPGCLCVGVTRFSIPASQAKLMEKKQLLCVVGGRILAQWYRILILLFLLLCDSPTMSWQTANHQDGTSICSLCIHRLHLPQGLRHQISRSLFILDNVLQLCVGYVVV